MHTNTTVKGAEEKVECTRGCIDTQAKNREWCEYPERAGRSMPELATKWGQDETGVETWDVPAGSIGQPAGKGRP